MNLLRNWCIEKSSPIQKNNKNKVNVEIFVGTILIIKIARRLTYVSDTDTLSSLF